RFRGVKWLTLEVLDLSGVVGEVVDGEGRWQEDGVDLVLGEVHGVHDGRLEGAEQGPAADRRRLVRLRADQLAVDLVAEGADRVGRRAGPGRVGAAAGLPEPAHRDRKSVVEGPSAG